MAKNNKAKGDALENAVRLIQESILKNDPKYTGIKFTIETKKIVRAAGVRHEIDLLVKTFPGSEYEATWIFECKNWKRPVGKNEVIILNRKVESLNATKGFLVAKEITKDAAAELENSKRLEAVFWSNAEINPADIQAFHTIHEPFSLRLHLKMREVPTGVHLGEMGINGARAKYGGESINLNDFGQQRVTQMANQDKIDMKTRYEFESVHWREIVQTHSFNKGQLVVNEMDVESMTIEASFFVYVQIAKIVSAFELKGLGSAYTLETGENKQAGAKVIINVVAR